MDVFLMRLWSLLLKVLAAVWVWAIYILVSAWMVRAWTFIVELNKD